MTVYKPYLIKVLLVWVMPPKIQHLYACSLFFLAWRIPWTEEPGGLQSIGSQRHDWVTNTFTLQPAFSISSGCWKLNHMLLISPTLPISIYTKKLMITHATVYLWISSCLFPVFYIEDLQDFWLIASNPPRSTPALFYWLSSIIKIFKIKTLLGYNL